MSWCSFKKFVLSKETSLCQNSNVKPTKHVNYYDTTLLDKEYFLKLITSLLDWLSWEVNVRSKAC